MRIMRLKAERVRILASVPVRRSRVLGINVKSERSNINNAMQANIVDVIFRIKILESRVVIETPKKSDAALNGLL